MRTGLVGNLRLVFFNDFKALSQGHLLGVVL